MIFVYVGLAADGASSGRGNLLPLTPLSSSGTFIQFSSWRCNLLRTFAAGDHVRVPLQMAGISFYQILDRMLGKHILNERRLCNVRVAVVSSSSRGTSSSASSGVIVESSGRGRSCAQAFSASMSLPSIQRSGG